MYHLYGYIDIKSVNLSHNTAIINYSPLTCYSSPTNGETYGTSISYSSFADNTASNFYCIYLNNYPSQIESSNIINNHQNNPGNRGLIYTYSNSKMNKCCIVDNDKSPIFQSVSGTLTLTECTIGEGQLDSKQGSVVGTGVSDSFIHGLTFIERDSCVNIFDTIENIPLTGVIQRTPDQTPSQKTCAEYLIAFPAHNIFQMLESFFMLCFLPNC